MTESLEQNTRPSEKHDVRAQFCDRVNPFILENLPLLLNAYENAQNKALDFQRRVGIGQKITLPEIDNYRTYLSEIKESLFSPLIHKISTETGNDQIFFTLLDARRHRIASPLFSCMDYARRLKGFINKENDLPNFHPKNLEIVSFLYSPEELRLENEDIGFYVDQTAGFNLGEKGITSEVLLPKDDEGEDVDVLVEHVPILTKEVFYELTKNALDALPHGGKIRIEVTVKENSVVITFSDTGEGIKEEDLLRIFEEGFTTKLGGTGKGLGIVKKYFEEILKGKFEVTSKVGKGTTFTITLPQSKKKEKDS